MDFEEKRQALVDQLKAYREEFGFDYDADNHARLLIQELELEIESEQEA